MAYIYLDELKDVLPAIMDQWIDGDDESWEWIFQEIEQKCHVGKRKKDKKRKEYAEGDIIYRNLAIAYAASGLIKRIDGEDWIRISEVKQSLQDVPTVSLGTKHKDKKRKKKTIKDIADLTDATYNAHEPKIIQLEKDVNELTRKVDDVIPKIMGDFDSRINAQTKRIDGLSNKVSNLNDKVNCMDNDIRATKLMAQTAKQRTEVDYTKCSEEKSDADVIQEVYNRMSGRGATFEELDAFRNLIQKYDALEKKEIPVIKKMCKTCKHDDGTLNFDDYPCSECNLNDKWEAKDNG